MGRGKNGRKRRGEKRMDEKKGKNSAAVGRVYFRAKWKNEEFELDLAWVTTLRAISFSFLSPPLLKLSFAVLDIFLAVSLCANISVK
jgi:hypothetical protein